MSTETANRSLFPCCSLQVGSAWFGRQHECFGTTWEQRRNKMSRQGHTASSSRTQGRSGYSVIFRHPVRRSDATGKPGLRVRSGLGTRDEEEAARLRDELNVLLDNSKYYNSSARPEAERRFDSRVVNIFFDKMVPEETDFAALRDAAIALPKSTPAGYRRVLLLGTTGAGKTTLVRQLIGTDPKRSASHRLRLRRRQSTTPRPSSPKATGVR